MQWDVTVLEKEYEELMEIARDELDPVWKHGQVIVLKTHSGQYYRAKISDIMDVSIREPVEEELIRTLMDCKDVRVLMCLCTMNGEHPEIPSWHLRSRLVDLNPDNLQTKTFLWGGGDTVFVKPFSALLPPQKNEDQ